MAGKLKTGLWKKAYLIEFAGADGTLLDSFTFSVPPESEELTYSQRKSETKTFGGLHVDDYGMDAVKITLSGSTVNRDLKRIYKPGEADRWMSGEREIYYLRDLIKEYKAGSQTEEIIITLYDLSKMYHMGWRVSEPGAIKNYWRVFPGDFKIRRSSDRPFTYKYSIEFTAVDYAPVRKILAKDLDFVNEALEKLKAGVEFMEKGMKYMDKAASWLEDVNSAIGYVTEVLDTYAGVVTGYFDAAAGIVDTVNEMLRIPADIAVKFVNIGLEFSNAAKRLVNAVENMTDTVLSYGSPEASGLADAIGEYGITGDEWDDIKEDFFAGLEDGAYTIAAASKAGGIPNVIATGNTVGGGSGSGGGSVSGSGSGGGSRQSFALAYGDFEVVLKSTDSLESLAAGYCGGPDAAAGIAAYNGRASLDELSPGDTIKIPILSPERKNPYNRIYALPEDRDNYGRDIRLDNNGCFMASAGGDFLLAGGADNLRQAVLLRLRERVRRRIRLGSYGIKTNISDPAAGVAYIISSINLTLSAEPRISAVDNISFTGAGDGLDITVEYTDINRSGGRAGGRA